MKLSLLSALLPALFAPGVFASHMAERGAAAAGSKIEKELVATADLGTKRGESRQEFLGRILLAIGKVSDKDWDGLSQDAQDWFNAAVDLRNEDKTAELADFKDLPKAAEPEPTSRRRGSDRAGAASTETKVGDVATVTTKRGKTTTGPVLEISDKIIVIDDGKGDGGIEFDRESQVASIEVKHGTAQDDGPAEPEVAVGVMVRLVTARDRTVEGEVIELTDDMVVIKNAEGEEEFMKDRLKSVTPVGNAQARQSTAAPASTRRGSAAAETPATDAKPARSVNAPGVTIGGRIRELIAEDHGITEEQIAKVLTKEGIAFKDASVRMNVADNWKMMQALDAAGALKNKLPERK